MPKLTDYAQTAAAIASEAAAIYGLYQQLEPDAKQQIGTDISKLKEGAVEIGAAIASWRSTSIVGKISASFAVFGAIDDGIDVVKGVYADGQKLFAADWPVVSQRIQNIENLLEGKSVTPAASAIASSASTGSL